MLSTVGLGLVRMRPPVVAERVQVCLPKVPADVSKGGASGGGGGSSGGSQWHVAVVHSVLLPEVPSSSSSSSPSKGDADVAPGGAPTPPPSSGRSYKLALCVAPSESTPDKAPEDKWLIKAPADQLRCIGGRVFKGRPSLYKPPPSIMVMPSPQPASSSSNPLHSSGGSHSTRSNSKPLPSPQSGGSNTLRRSTPPSSPLPALPPSAAAARVESGTPPGSPSVPMRKPPRPPRPSSSLLSSSPLSSLSSSQEDLPTLDGPGSPPSNGSGAASPRNPGEPPTPPPKPEGGHTLRRNVSANIPKQLPAVPASRELPRSVSSSSVGSLASSTSGSKSLPPLPLPSMPADSPVPSKLANIQGLTPTPLLLGLHELKSATLRPTRTDN